MHYEDLHSARPQKSEGDGPLHNRHAVAKEFLMVRNSEGDQVHSWHKGTPRKAFRRLAILHRQDVTRKYCLENFQTSRIRHLLSGSRRSALRKTAYRPRTLGLRAYHPDVERDAAEEQSTARLFDIGGGSIFGILVAKRIIADELFATINRAP